MATNDVHKTQRNSVYRIKWNASSQYVFFVILRCAYRIKFHPFITKQFNNFARVFTVSLQNAIHVQQHSIWPVCIFPFSLHFSWYHFSVVTFFAHCRLCCSFIFMPNKLDWPKMKCTCYSFCKLCETIKLRKRRELTKQRAFQ